MSKQIAAALIRIGKKGQRDSLAMSVSLDAGRPVWCVFLLMLSKLALALKGSGAGT